MSIWSWLSGNNDSDNNDDYKEGDIVTNAEGKSIVVDKTVSMPGEYGWEQVGVYGHEVGQEPVDVNNNEELVYDPSSFYPYDDLE
jgi:hypothetical protein